MKLEKNGRLPYENKREQILEKVVRGIENRFRFCMNTGEIMQAYDEETIDTLELYENGRIGTEEYINLQRIIEASKMKRIKELQQ